MLRLILSGIAIATLLAGAAYGQSTAPAKPAATTNWKMMIANPPAKSGTRERPSRAWKSGEVRARRSATVTALSRTSLLVLDAHDLHALMARQPQIAERIREVARKRLEGRKSDKGDLLTEELEGAETPGDDRRHHEI